MTIIGISDSHNAAAALLRQDGSLIALQEERPRRIKNYFDVPTQSIGWLLEEGGLMPGDVEELALCNTVPLAPLTREQIIDYFRKAGQWRGGLRDRLRGTPLQTMRWRRMRAVRQKRYEALGFKPAQIVSYDHHLCHAATAYYGQEFGADPVLVVTLDGAGDGLCATISIGKDGQLERLYTVDESHSIGTLFALITYMTGMVPNEHEYKLMGMAPYASPKASAKVRDKLLGLYEWDHAGKPVWRRKRGVPHSIRLQPVLEKLFYEERFDAIMGGAQMFVEHMVCELIRRAIATTGLHDVRASGGVFMNVKANKLITELDDVKSLFIFPSCGDETNAIGAAWLAQARRHGAASIKPLNGFYLGPEWAEDVIATAIAPLQSDNAFKVEKPENINDAVVACLVAGDVVARFAGREEFGARSLGNRAIIADPRNPKVIQRINEMIKSRDFWMPFASSLLAEAEETYLINPKRIAAPYMILSFDTTPAGAQHLQAGVHPYDLTCRPQVVTKAANPDYWDLLHRFQTATGVGGILNTSLNLHGLPLVHRPEDALHVLQNSGLTRLQLGPYLISKQEHTHG